MQQVNNTENSSGDGRIKPQAICAIDLDNLLNDARGHARIQIDKFVERIFDELGDDCVIRVFANRLTEGETQAWESAGAFVTVVGYNVDPVMASWLNNHGSARRIGICSGDHHFARLARHRVKQKHRVVVWARKHKASHELVFAASKIDFDLEELLLSPGSRQLH